MLTVDFRLLNNPTNIKISKSSISHHCNTQNSNKTNKDNLTFVDPKHEFPFSFTVTQIEFEI